MELKSLFSPLDKKWCNYFLLISIFSFILFCLTIIHVIYSAIKSPKKFNIFGKLSIILSPLIFYFQSRLFYSMCI
jgi:hypothetical protein